jgi:hypothetical protein
MSAHSFAGVQMMAARVTTARQAGSKAGSKAGRQAGRQRNVATRKLDCELLCHNDNRPIWFNVLSDVLYKQESVEPKEFMALG